VPKRNMSAVKRLEFVSNRMTYIILGGMKIFSNQHLGIRVYMKFIIINEL
jgi:hypothetical protein